MSVVKVSSATGPARQVWGCRSKDRDLGEIGTAARGISVVIPVFNEMDNVQPLHQEIVDALVPLQREFEVIFVDDASTDKTFERLSGLARDDPRVSVLRLARNFGQSAAIQAGFDHARGEVFITLDGDLQNDPSDIPMLLRELRSDCDLIAGWRRNRQDSRTTRLLPSRIANWLVRTLTGVTIHDNGCTLRAYRRELVDKNRIYADLHRFMVPILTLSGAYYREVEVNHRPRLHGESKYGLARTWQVILDLLAIKMILRFASHPAAWFAILSFPLFVTASLSGVMSLIGWFGLSDSESVPIVLSSISLITLVASVNLLFFGFLGELVVRHGDAREAAGLLTRVESS